MIKIYFRRFLSMDESRWPEIYPKVDPLAAAKMADVSRLVPVIAVHGTEDELVHPSQPLMLKDVYDGIGAEFSLVTVKNGTHSFGNVPGFPLASPNIEEIQCLLFGFAEKHVL